MMTMLNEPLASGAFPMDAKCSCGNSSFKVTETEVANSTFIFNFVHCTRCRNTVGVLDNMNIGEMLLKQNEAIQKIADRLGVKVFDRP